MKKIFYTLALAIMIVQALYSQNWQGLPGGSLNDRVTAIIYFGGYLWVGGIFTNAGPIVTQNIVRHDGNGWVATPALPSSPYSFSVYGNELFALGGFDIGGLRYGIMKWSGTSWLPMAHIDSWGIINSAVTYNGELILGGYFYSIDGIPAQSLVRWNGSSWQTFSGQTSCFWTWPARINGLHVANGWLYAGGAFDIIGGVNAGCAGKWNGTLWAQLSIGWNTYASGFADSAGSIFVVGIFPYAGASSSHSVAREGPSGWINAGAGLQMNAFTTTEFQNKIYVGGSVSSASGTYVGNLGYWNGSSWISDNQGIAGGMISCLYNDQANNRLYAGGSFNVSGGDLLDYIAFKSFASLPVELTSFDCKVVGEKILAQWITASETNASHFTLSISNDGQSYREIGYVAGHGTTTETNRYTFYCKPNISGIVYLQLKGYDYDGTLSGSWDCAVKIRSKNIITYDNFSETISCGECKEELFVYSSSGNLVDRKKPPISTEDYQSGVYCVKEIKSQQTLRFVVIKK